MKSSPVDGNFVSFLDHLKVDKLSKRKVFLFRLFLYTENVNTVANVTYKDNEHLAVKCIVLQSRGMDGAGRPFKRLLMTRSLQICGCLGTRCTFVVTMATSVYLQLGIQCEDEDDG